ncbi:transcription intermediary factor 1-beta-like [Ostrea edulis]|uniref:transcription intermediary factor 1-beta-like n=1 Tax=Ostrea edulis TaxID=37623 RepID=UPI0024AFA246|nr:transcription intermediary factor 1-beta-like [Ostrea edulis]
MMATALGGNVDKDLVFSCPICLESVRTPRCLPCLHTFCESCIQTYISSTAIRKEEEYQSIECPVCRKESRPPAKYMSSDEWAISLPINYLVNSVSVKSSESEKLCVTCKRQGKDVAAIHWCKNCMEKICDDCKTLHSYVSILQNHKIVNLSEANGCLENFDVDEPCSIHKNKTIEVYCGDHDKLCCSVCFATQHRRCERVEALEDVSSRFDRTDIQPRLEIFSKSLEMLENLQENNREQVDKLKARKEVICRDVADKIEKAKRALDEGFSQWQKQFEEKHGDCLQTLDIACDEMRRFSTTLKEARFTFSLLQEKGSLKQLFVMTHRLESQIAEHFQRLKLKMDVETFSDYQHSMGSEFTDFVSNNRKVPDVKCIQSKPLCGTVAQLSIVVSTHTSSSIAPKLWLANMDLMNFIPQKVSEYDIYSNHGLYRYNDTVLLSVGQTIQIYDVRGNTWIHLYTEKCNHNPHAIAQTEVLHEVYVAFGTYIAVHNINEGNQMSLLRKIPMSPGVMIQSFTLMDDTIICADNSGITILNLDFSVKEKRNITIDGGIAYVAASNKTKKIAFVKKTGIEEQTVTSQNLSGDTHFEYKMKRQYLRGIAFDSQDNIYVCDFHEKNELVQISSDGKKSRTISSAISNPYSILFHPEGHRFLVLSNNERICRIYEIPQSPN